MSAGMRFSETSLLDLQLTTLLADCGFFVVVFFPLIWTILKVITEFVTILLLFYVFGSLAMRHVAS